VTAIAAPALALERESAPAGPLLAAEGVVRRYGEGDGAVEALAGVSLEIDPGRLTAVMGPSGSGKSTLMHILAGLDSPSEGSVVLDGVELTALSEKKLTLLRRDKIGFVFQFFNLLPMLSAEENILLPLELAGRKPDKQWLAELLETTGIASRRKHRPAELSGGQQQRVAIARALVSRPKVLFADEPTGNLDSSSSREVLKLLRRTVDGLGQTTLMVTHDPQAAAQADRILFLADGRIVRDLAESTAAEVLAAMQEVTKG
jgi:putative ABC transport system ATP-binding protein